ncbi:MAG: hypothetical protein ACI8PT_000615 [Gammaproteobacteria bacterium]|jgi:hypothetical protein
MSVLRVCPVRSVLLSLALTLLFHRAGAAVQDVFVADVTPRAFSVIWASDQPIEDALDVAVMVFEDTTGDGQPDTDRTGTLTQIVTSNQTALDNGIVKIDVVGTNADTMYFVTTLTNDAVGGSFTEPASGPGLPVATAARTTRVGTANQPITNDVLVRDLFLPDGTTPAAGALLSVSAPAFSPYPLTAFVGEHTSGETTGIDTSNFFDITGVSAALPEDTMLHMTLYRGLSCAGLVNHRLINFRKAPAHLEPVTITEEETAPGCFFADTICDGTINGLDFQRVLNIFGQSAGGCRFNDDLDIVSDGVINGLDFQAVLNRFGDSEPFLLMPGKLVRQYPAGDAVHRAQLPVATRAIPAPGSYVSYRSPLRAARVRRRGGVSRPIAAGR